MPAISIVLIVICAVGFIALQMKKKRDQAAEEEYDDSGYDQQLAAQPSQPHAGQQQVVQQQAAPAGQAPDWYPDPWKHARLRYFDPAQGGWTEHTAA